MEKEEKFESQMKNFVIERKVDIGLLIIGAVLGIYFDWTMIEVVIFIVFIWSVVGPLPSRFLAAMTIFFLLFTPILHFLKRPERAEEFAVYAYYFLVMAVIRAIAEVRKEIKDGKEA
jgi:hypothetical protein